MFAMSVFSVCFAHNIQLHLERIPREMNQQSDYLSKIVDYGDWRISDAFFQYVQSLWGQFSVDRFAYYQNAKLARFISKFWNPDSEAVNCFLVSWTGENNYLVPFVHLVLRCLRPLLQCKAEGTLITPTRHSVSLWPFIISRGWKTRSFYCGF